MKPKFLFTLGGDLGTQIISEPEGWAKIIFNLERDLTYWSLIENFEVPLIFYGVAESKDGGYTYLKEAILTGIDTKVLLDIQISFDDGESYELCFDGRIDLSTAKEVVYRSKIEAAIVRNDLWAVFMAKKTTPIDLFSTTDIYGNSRLSINKQELNLPSQKIRKQIIGTYDPDQDIEIVPATLLKGSNTINYLVYSLEKFIVTELEELITGYSYQLATTTPQDDLLFFLDAKEKTTINVIKGTLQVEGNFLASTSDQVTVKWFFSYGNRAVGFTNVQLGSTITDGNLSLGHLFFSITTTFDYETPFTLNIDDELYIYAEVTYPGSDKNSEFLSNLPSYSLTVIGDTTIPDTTTDSVLLHDAGLSICDRILGKDDSFYSEFLGGQYSSIHYPSNGCGYLNALTRGLNIRGYTFTEKPFTLSFDDWWAGVNPIYNLGLGYEDLSTTSPGSTVIRVEDKAGFFNPTPSVYLTAINDIKIEFDLNLFTKTIEIGFEQWSAESASGIDDPQTKHIYGLRYQLFGKDEKQLSKFIAASLAIEQGRRLRKIQSNDWRLDDNKFIISLQQQTEAGSSPSSITQQPELFNSGVTNLNNSETRYNIRHTPARMLKRWLNFYSNQMQNYLADFFKYASGEGNVLMSWTGNGCDSGSLIENQNQSISSNYLFLPIVYSFTHPLTWDEYTTIRDNRKNAISISWILSGVTYTKIAFIKKLGYDINKSKGTFEVWIRS